LSRGSGVDYERDHKSPLTIRFTFTHTSAEALGTIRNQAIEPIATAPLSAVITRSSQEILSMLLLDICETAAASEFAGAIVSMLAAVTMVAAGDDASVAGAPCVLAGSMPLVSSGEANRAVSPSITRSFAVTRGAPFEVLSLDVGLVEARFFAAGWALLENNPNTPLPTANEGQLNIARGELRTVYAELEQLTIRAPIASTVLQWRQRLGKLALPSAPQALVVLDTS
jgi:hypothetical protein